MDVKPDTYPYYDGLTAYSDEYRGMTISVLSIAVLNVSAKLNN